MSDPLLAYWAKHGADNQMEKQAFLKGKPTQIFDFLGTDLPVMWQAGTRGMKGFDDFSIRNFVNNIDSTFPKQNQFSEYGQDLLRQVRSQFDPANPLNAKPGMAGVHKAYYANKAKGNVPSQPSLMTQKEVGDIKSGAKPNPNQGGAPAPQGLIGEMADMNPDQIISHLYGKTDGMGGRAMDCFPERKRPVMEAGFLLMDAGVPSATTCPPNNPAPGPMSTIQSAASMVSRSCSITTSELPMSLRWASVSRRRMLSR